MMVNYLARREARQCRQLGHRIETPSPADGPDDVCEPLSNDVLVSILLLTSPVFHRIIITISIPQLLSETK